jgi:autotransporter-associated beta strand protein
MSLVRTRGIVRSSSLVLAAAITAALAPAASAADYWWDVNGSAPGSGGPSPNGVWDGVATNFTNVAAGDGALPTNFFTLANPSFADRIVFSAGTDATSPFTVTVSGVRAIGSIHRDAAPEVNATLVGTEGAKLYLGALENNAFTVDASLPVVIANSNIRFKVNSGRDATIHSAITRNHWSVVGTGLHTFGTIHLAGAGIENNAAGFVTNGYHWIPNNAADPTTNGGTGGFSTRESNGLMKLVATTDAATPDDMTSASTHYRLLTGGSLTADRTAATLNFPGFADGGGSNVVTLAGRTLTTNGIFYAPNNHGSGGSLLLNFDGSQGGQIAIGETGVLNILAGRTVYFTAPITGNGEVVMGGTYVYDVVAYRNPTPVITYTVPNTYTGQTSVAAGAILEIANNNQLGDPTLGKPVLLNGGKLRAYDNVTLDNAGANVRNVILADTTADSALAAYVGKTMTVNGTVSGANGLFIEGGGTVNLRGGGSVGTGSNLTGGAYFSVTSGTLNLTGAPMVSNTWYRMNVGWNNATPGVLNIDGTTLTQASGAEINIGGNYNGNENGTGILTIAGTAASPGKLDTGTTGGAITIGVNSNKAGAGTLNLEAHGVLATNRVIINKTLADSATINFNGGTLQATGNNLNVVAAAVGTPPVPVAMRINVRNGGAVVDTQAFNSSIAHGLVHSNIDGDAAVDGGLTKLGAGQLVLGGENTYTGPTNVNAGTLVVNGSHVGGGAYTVAAGARLGGTGTVSSAVNASGRLAPGSGGVGTLTVAAPLALAGAASGLDLDIESASAFDKLVVNGTAAVAGTITPTLLAGYVPASGDSFEVMTATSISGTFSNAFGHARAADGKGGLLIEVTPTSVVLKNYQLVGDVDVSGAVNNQDIAPFVALLTGGSPTGAVGFAADVDGNGVVNNQDIAPFVALLTGGRPLADVAGDPEFAPLIALVPEPGTLSLLAAAGVLALRRRRG